MYDLTTLTDNQLFKVRDCCIILMQLGFTLVKDLLQECNREQNDRERNYGEDKNKGGEDVL